MQKLKNALQNIDITYALLFSITAVYTALMFFALNFNSDGLYSFHIYYETFLQSHRFFTEWNINAGRLYDFSTILYSIYYPITHNLNVASFLITVTYIILFVLGSFYLVNSFNLSKGEKTSIKKWLLLFYNVSFILFVTQYYGGTIVNIFEDHITQGGNYSIGIIAGLFCIGILIRSLRNNASFINVLIMLFVAFAASLFHKLFIVIFFAPSIGILTVFLFRKIAFKIDEFNSKRLTIIFTLLVITAIASVISWHFLEKYLEFAGQHGPNPKYFEYIARCFRNGFKSLYFQHSFASLLCILLSFVVLFNALYGVHLLVKSLFTKEPLLNTKYKFFPIYSALFCITMAFASMFVIGIYDTAGFVRYQQIIVVLSLFTLSFALSKVSLDRLITRVIFIIWLVGLVIGFQKLKFYKISASDVVNFNNPYNYEKVSKCFHENAKELGLNSGFSDYWKARPVLLQHSAKFDNKNLWHSPLSPISTANTSKVIDTPFLNVFRWMQNVTTILDEKNVFNYTIVLDQNFNGVYIKPSSVFYCANQSGVKIPVQVYQNHEFDKRVKIKLKEHDFIYRQNNDIEPSFFNINSVLDLSGYSLNYSQFENKLLVVGPYGNIVHIVKQKNGLKASKGKYKMTIEYIFHGANIQDVKWGVQLAKQNTAPWWVMKPSNLPSKKGKLEKEFVLEEDNMYMNYIFVLENETKNNPSLMEIRGVVIEKM